MRRLCSHFQGFKLNPQHLSLCSSTAVGDADVTVTENQPQQAPASSSATIGTWSPVATSVNTAYYNEVTAAMNNILQKWPTLPIMDALPEISDSGLSGSPGQLRQLHLEVARVGLPLLQQREDGVGVG